MKIAATIARYLMGLMFTIFGLNGFLNFLPQSPIANPLASQFFMSITASHLAAFFFAVQLLAGLLLLAGYFVPLALTLLAAEIYNILAFHITLAPEGIALALFAAVMWILVFTQYKSSFTGLFTAKPPVSGQKTREQAAPHLRTRAT